MTHLTQKGIFISYPVDLAKKIHLNATVDNLLEKYGLKAQQTDVPKEPAPAPKPAPKPPRQAGRSTAMTKEKKDAIKGGAAIGRMRRGH